MIELKGMNIHEGVDYVIKQLDQSELDYSRANRGFAALHDLMDANMLLPNCEDFNPSDTGTVDYYNALMDELTTILTR